MRQAPARTCVGCRRTRAKADLARIVRSPDGVRYDPEQRSPGRGAYVCHDPQCVEAAARRGGHPVRRALRGGRPDEVTEALAAVMGTLPRERSPHDSTGGSPKHHEEQNA